MKSVIIFQRAKISDLAQFLKIEKSVANLKTYSAIIDKDEALKEFKNSIVYFIKNNKDIIGSVYYEIKSKNHAYLSGIIILPKFQGKGIGYKAMNYILKKLKKMKRIDVKVHPKNNKAMRLYKYFGFKAESIIENCYGDGQLRILMVKNLY